MRNSLEIKNICYAIKSRPHKKNLKNQSINQVKKHYQGINISNKDSDLQLGRHLLYWN